MNESLLMENLAKLNVEYYDGKVNVAGVRWMSPNAMLRGAKLFGRFNCGTRIIELSPLLLKDLDVLRFVLFHELCHAYVSQWNLVVHTMSPHGEVFMQEWTRWPFFWSAHRRYVFFAAQCFLERGWLCEDELRELGMRVDDGKVVDYFEVIGLEG